jgi:hypothetical protein
MYRVFIVQAYQISQPWCRAAAFSRSMYTVFIVQSYQIPRYVVPRGGIFLGK